MRLRAPSVHLRDAGPSAALLCALAATLTRAPSAAAQQPTLPSLSPEATAAAARTEFEQGLRSLDDGRFAEAVVSLERSLALRNSGSALYNLGLALRGTGSYRRAIVTFERFLATVPPSSNEARDANAILAELRRGLVRVRVRAVGETAELLVDDARVSAGDGTSEFQLDPGSHRFEARRPGYAPARVERSFIAGEQAELVLDASEAPLPAHLEVELSPRDAELRLDGVVVGHGNASLTTGPGRHRLEATALGREPEVRELQVQADGRLRVALTLRPRPVPIARNPWLWIGITGGVVLVTTIIATGVGVAGARATPPDQGTWGFTVRGLSWR